MTGTPSELIRAFWIGMRFDLRLACFILLPLGLAFMIPVINPMTQSVLRKMARIYLWLVTVLVIFLYAFDFGNYAYLDQRLDISSIKLQGEIKKRKTLNMSNGNQSFRLAEAFAAKCNSPGQRPMAC